MSNLVAKFRCISDVCFRLTWEAGAASRLSRIKVWGGECIKVTTLSWLRYSIITMFQRHWSLVTRVSGCHLTMTSSHISTTLTPPLLHPLYQWSVSPLVCRGQYLLQCWPVVMCTMLPVSPGPLQTRCVSRGWMRSRLKYSTQCVPVTSRDISAVLWVQYSFWPLSTICHVF